MGRRSGGWGPAVTAVVVVAAVFVAAVVPAVAAAHGRAPTLLYDSPSTTFVARPPFMSFDESRYKGGTFNYFEGPGVTLSRLHHGHASRIHWVRYGAEAVGRGTSLSQSCSSLRGRILYCTQRYIALPSTIRAWRVRDGR